MNTLKSFTAGLSGAVALTVFHQVLKQYVEDSPRMDKLGQQALKKALEGCHFDIPPKASLRTLTFIGDILGNALFYSIVGIKPSLSPVTGATLGLAAGVGAVALPGKMGLKTKYSGKTTRTKLLTIGLYLTGGLVAGTVHLLISKPDYEK